jgi:hypothetical protein
VGISSPEVMSLFLHNYLMLVVFLADVGLRRLRLNSAGKGAARATFGAAIQMPL